jgi:hypothetical protein
MAASMPESAAVKRWLQLALEYEQLADGIERAMPVAAPPQAQQVAMQQQRLAPEEPRDADKPKT